MKTSRIDSSGCRSCLSFCPSDQANEIYKRLPDLLYVPSKHFTRRLAELEGGALFDALLIALL